MASDNNCHATNGPGGPLPEYFSEILRGKDKMIKVQAKRIEMLEYEVHRLRLVRETLSSQLALAICQLQQQGRLPPGQPLETAFLASSSESVALQANGLVMTCNYIFFISIVDLIYLVYTFKLPYECVGILVFLLF